MPSLQEGQVEKRIVITTGGTGGHIYPAIALAEKLQAFCPQIRSYFVGGKLATNPYFLKDSFPFKEVPCGMWSRKGGICSILREMRGIYGGIKESYQFLKQYQPQLVVGFGSYYTFPVLCAARLAGIPYVLHEANAIPGKVIKLFSGKALFTGIHFSAARQYLKGKILEIALPIRKDFIKHHLSQQEARALAGLHPHKKTCLIFGGSQGASILNDTVLNTLEILNKNDIQFWHITGNLEAAEKAQQAYKQKQIQAYVTSFETRMDVAWSAADFALTRAGAGTIAEAMSYEVPLILIPFPQAADQHQDKNADFVVEVIKGGAKIQQLDLNYVKLGTLFNTLTQNGGLQTWKENLRCYRQFDRSKELHHVIIDYLEGKER
nr:UDP-N-acetylglucosamine--N-acetylmuramyl-(pentapeptide) pyrophosphoryl-undecaprenol N-acetylglucosamine transferase [Parachlamydia sp. AcF125]